jgi:two-component system LytT family response regulator
MKYSVIIVDDEKHQQDKLTDLLEKNFSSYTIAAVCTSVKEGIIKINALKPDLVFLDVIMPPETGFDLLEQIPDRSFEVVFTTSYEEYAIKAFKVSAVDYLLKPFGKTELGTALQRFESRKASPVSFNHLELLMHNLQQSSTELAAIALPTSKGFLRVKVEDIIRCEADNMYTTFFFRDKSQHVVSKNLKECEEILIEYKFIRTHLSHLINLRYVKEYLRGDGGSVVMSDGSSVDVSRNRKEDFLRAFKRI